MTALFLPEHERFYRRREVDVKVLNYPMDKTVYDLPDSMNQMVNVYPDTVRWVKDFPFSFCEPMCNMYAWHPAYDDYPVTCVTYFQALAYCKWVEKKINAEHETKDVRYEVRLPNDVEWEWTVTVRDRFYDLRLADKSWKTDLLLTIKDWRAPEQIEGEPENYSHRQQPAKMLNYNMAVWENWIANRAPGTLAMDGEFFTHKVRLPEKTMKRYAKKGAPSDIHYYHDIKGEVSGLGGNVSEWMDNTYEQWKIAFDARMALLAAIGTDESNMIRTNEMYWDKTE